MRIVIDCFKQIKGVGKSIGIYNVALNLIKNLVKYKDTSEDKRIRNAELIVIGNKYNKEDFDIKGVNFVCVINFNPLNKVHCVIWELFAVSSVCKKLRADRVLFPRGYCALTHPVKDTIIIHDLIPFYYNEHFPKVFNKVENAYIMNRLKVSANSCNNVITISEASKLDILKYCGIKDDKITVIHNGCNEIFYNEKKDIKKKAYICTITSGLPHKNAKGILKAYQEYCKIAEKPLDLQIIGLEDTSCVELSDDVKSKVTCYKFIKENNELHRIIANSKVFLFLSLVEGFGFPPIEAMQLDVPTICSNISSIPEIVGNASILVNPEEPLEIAKALDDLIQNEAFQKTLIEKGKENVKRFYWDNQAELYWNVLVKK